MKSLDSIPLFRFYHHDRGCYSSKEVSFRALPKDLFRYSYENCLMEASFQALKDNCKCQRGLGTLSDPFLRAEESKELLR